LTCSPHDFDALRTAESACGGILVVMDRLRSPATLLMVLGLAMLIASCGGQSSNSRSIGTATTSTAPSYGTTKAASSEVWAVPVSRLRKLGTADPRVAILRNTLDQMASNTVLIKVERFSTPVDYSNRVMGRSNHETPTALADTFITISDLKGSKVAWQPADYGKVKDLLALLPAVGTKKSSAP
jgi:hypothetical protein